MADQKSPRSSWRARRRGRLFHGTLAFVAIAAVTAGTVSNPADTPADVVAAAPQTQSVELAGKVRPGTPVPLSIITAASLKQYLGRGNTGRGIDVALIDSGVSPVKGLDKPGKVIYGPDLSNEGSVANLANLDTFGHGTHLAGIINGDDGNLVGGVAPGSRIVSVKVAGATGETDVAQVVAAIDWVVEHRNDKGLNIRVLNLSLGVPGIATNQGDPLSIAVERAWDAGIVVVAAAGNRGNTVGGIDSPALSPYVIAVGATESYDSTGRTDTIATWSSGGNAFRSPDVMAPGRSLISFRVPGSALDAQYPEARYQNSYFLGSGTSQSAAVVSGFAAGILSAAPHLTPDQVKFLFQRAAVPITRQPVVEGQGRIEPGTSIVQVKNAGRAPTQNHGRALGKDKSNQPVAVLGATWSGGAWNGATWSGGVWSGATWSGATWSGATWSGGVWSGATWSGATWSGATWSGATWSGATWSGATWSGATWSGATWSGATWSGATWSGVDLAGGTWS